MFDEKSDPRADAGSIEAASRAADSGKGFKSRRMPLTVTAYKYLVVQTGKEIALARAELVPMPETPIGRYRERHARRDYDPAEVRERLQGLLLDGLLVARMRLPSGVIVRVSSEAFGDGSEDTFDRMERGLPITALVFANDLLDRSIALDEVTGERTGVVFFYEEEFRSAQANDPITEIEDHPLAPVVQTEAPQALVAQPDSAAATAERDKGGRPEVYVGLDEAIDSVAQDRSATSDDGTVIVMRFANQDAMVEAVRAKYAPQLKKLVHDKKVKSNDEPSKQTIIDRCQKHSLYGKFCSARSQSKNQ